MIASVTVSSDVRLRPLASAFGSDFARAVGASEPDADRLAGVLDEAVRFVSEHAYPGDAAGRIARAFPHAGPGRLIAAPDCGMKYLPRDAAYGKLEALVAGARLAVERAVTA